MITVRQIRTRTVEKEDFTAEEWTLFRRLTAQRAQLASTAQKRRNKRLLQRKGRKEAA